MRYIFKQISLYMLLNDIQLRAGWIWRLEFSPPRTKVLMRDYWGRSISGS